MSRMVIAIDQEKYLRDVLLNYKMDKLKPASIPLSSSLATQLLSQLPDAPCLSPKDTQLMQSQAGSLLYAVTGTRPDIAQAVGLVCRHMHSPTSVDLEALKHIFRYLVSHISASLFFPYAEVTEPLRLTAFSDVSWNCEVSSSHSTGGHLVCMTTGGVLSPIVWSSHKQALVTRSVTEAEFVEASAAAQELEWLRIFLEGAQIPFVLPIPLSVDNQSAIALVRNPVHHKATKHIRSMYHYVQQAVSLGSVSVVWCNTEDNLADPLTKSVPLPVFEHFFSSLFSH